VLEAIRSLDNVTMLLITHDVDCALALTGKAFVMRNGVFVDRIGTKSIIEGFAHPYTETLVHSCPHFWNIGMPGMSFNPVNQGHGVEADDD
jgi:ABC-type glutathione transport system ATPase component